MHYTIYTILCIHYTIYALYKGLAGVDRQWLEWIMDNNC